MIIAIIGIGPRGLLVLQSIIGAARQTNRECMLLLIDPQGPGPGIHQTSRGHLLLNTVAGLPTQYNGSPELGTGPSFFDFSSMIKNIEYGSYLSRKTMGDYLAAVYADVIASAPTFVQTRHIPFDAVDIAEGNRGYIITLSDGSRIASDSIVLTTGHGSASDRLHTSEWGFAPHEILRNEKIGLVGFGLTALDIIAEFTVGRGGRFRRDPTGKLLYHPSENEPRFYLFSRTGRPFRSRPHETQELPAAPVSTLTPDTVDRLVKRRPVSFQEDLEPLIIEELRQRLKQEFRENDLLKAPFDVHTILSPSFPRSSSSDYASAALNWLKADLAEARRGFSKSPLKRGLEHLLHIRPIIRQIVDFGGLTELSQSYFYSSFTSMINRNVIGPQLERTEELLALVECGLVSLSLGPAPLISPNGAAWRIRSKLPPFEVLTVDKVLVGYQQDPSSKSVLIQNLLKAGLAYRNGSNGKVPGIKTDTNFNLLDAIGRPQPRIWAIGPHCEGTTYYNNYLPVCSKVQQSPIFEETKHIAYALLR